MDSKLRRTAILSCLAAILAVSLIVLYTNKEPRRGSNGSRTNVADGGTTEEPDAAKDQKTGQGALINGQIGNDLFAYLRDDSFFDPEVNSVLEEAKNLANRISLVVTSVEKDLRVQVVDSAGMLVAGESFLLDLSCADTAGKTDAVAQKEGTYKDLDKDGVIYIGDLAAGEYYVRLQPIGSYKVPVSETRVRVKEKVEYLPIEDISLLIKTEDEVDAHAEDSRVADALGDADKTQVEKLQISSNRSKAGIDVSKWQGDIDWDRVKKAGVEFAIIRAGYRGSVTGSLVQDVCFDVNMKGATASGIPVGVYFFTQATNEVEAVEEASAVLKWVREYDVTYPIFIDTEGAGGEGRADHLDVETRTQVCEAFCRTIENAGYTGGVYASRNWYNNNLQVKKLENYYIWLAEYRSTPLYQGYYRMWQYSSKGKIDGINGNVDLDIMYE